MTDSFEQRISRLESLTTRLETLMVEHAAICPYREDIARAKNNIAAIAKLESRVYNLEITVARSGAIGGIAGGGAVGGIIAIFFGLGRLFNWW